jgi:hypothetical protein
VLVLVLVPRAVASMFNDLKNQTDAGVFNVFSSAPIDFSAAVPENSSFVNIAVTDIDEATRSASLIVSGSRNCDPDCLPVTVTLFSLGQEAARRLGLPPSATVTLPADAGPYTDRIALPIQGWPQRYPFDAYTLTLGVAADETLPSGRLEAIEAEDPRLRELVMTVEGDVARLSMKPPQALDPDAARSQGSDTPFVAVTRLEFERPPYLRILSILLVLLVSASAIFALTLHNLKDLLLGVGGIILSVWGVRSVLVQTTSNDLTWIDVALALVILALLLGLAIRAAGHYYQLSGFRSASAVRESAPVADG